MDFCDPLLFDQLYTHAAFQKPTGSALTLNDVQLHVPGTCVTSDGRCIHSFTLFLVHVLLQITFCFEAVY